MVIRLEKRTPLIKAIVYEFITFNLVGSTYWKESITPHDLGKDSEFRDIVITTYLTRYPDGNYFFKELATAKTNYINYADKIK